MGVKFCGHCNAHMDMFSLYEQLRGRLPQVAFCFYASDPDVALLLLMQACAVGCARAPEFLGKTITVTPDELDHWPTARSLLLPRLAEAVVGALGPPGGTALP